MIGIDIRSEKHWARTFDNRGMELSKKAFGFSNTAEGFASFEVWYENQRRAAGIVFTNGNDCQRYIKEFILKYLPASTLFQMGCMSFTLAVEMAEKHRMDLLIDPVSEPGDRFITYFPYYMASLL
ncbi:MAG: hypothetical protein IKE24_00750 [Clostridia bacterium]|nr:hypothetical protein [Clostridia bacterium]